jgi:O-antigen/teichoic acid export membrane protein
MLKRLKSLASQSTVYGLGGLLPKAIAFLLLPLYTQFLTPADYGILAFTTTINSVLLILLELGLGSAVTRFNYDYLNDEKERRAYYGTIWIFLTIASLLLTLLLDWQGESWFSLLFEETPYHPYGRLAVWLAFFTLAQTIPLVLFRVREQAYNYTLFTVGRFLFNTLAIVLFVAGLRQGAEGSLKAQLLVGIMFFVPFTLVTLRHLRLAFHWNKLKASLAFGLPMIPHALSSWVLNVSDRILLERYVSLDELGLYNLGYRLAMILDLVLFSINSAWAPFFFRTAATEKDAPKTFARLTTYYTLLMLTLSLGIALLSKPLLVFMAKPAFRAAYPVVPVVVLAYISHGFYFMVVNQLFYAKKIQRLPLYTMISAAVNITLNLLTLGRYGIMAAAWNTVIGFVVLFALVFRESARVYPVPYEYKRLAILFGAAGFIYFLGSLVSPGNPYLEFVIRSAIIALFPLALLLLRFFTPQETGRAKTMLAQWTRRLTAHSS